MKVYIDTFMVYKNGYLYKVIQGLHCKGRLHTLIYNTAHCIGKYLDTLINSTRLDYLYSNCTPLERYTFIRSSNMERTVFAYKYCYILFVLLTSII